MHHETAKIIKTRKSRELAKLAKLEKTKEPALLAKEPIRIPEDAVRFCRKGIGRDNGRKPKYKDIRSPKGRLAESDLLIDIGSSQTLEEFADLIAEQQLGIRLSAKQRKFVRLIKQKGVCVRMSEAAKQDQEFQKLTGILAGMHKSGIIPNFLVVNV